MRFTKNKEKLRLLPLKNMKPSAPELKFWEKKNITMGYSDSVKFMCTWSGELYSFPYFLFLSTALNWKCQESWVKWHCKLPSYFIYDQGLLFVSALQNCYRDRANVDRQKARTPRNEARETWRSQEGGSARKSRAQTYGASWAWALAKSVMICWPGRSVNTVQVEQGAVCRLGLCFSLGPKD